MNYNTFIHAVAGVNEVLHKQAAMQKAAAGPGKLKKGLDAVMGYYGGSLPAAQKWYTNPYLTTGLGASALGAGIGGIAGGDLGSAGMGAGIGLGAGLGGAYGLQSLAKYRAMAAAGNPLAAGHILNPLENLPRRGYVPMQPSMASQFNQAYGPVGPGVMG